ncbi:MAG TPA: ATP-binding protein [Blastocatellia bacterium]|jgi:PAS domain S-box-containing protein|nr:ATP-binding protein [Blastocatellia bacterium]
MGGDYIRRLPGRFFGFPRTAEWLVRNILLLGFFVLLALVGGLGYLSWQGFRQLEGDITAIRESEVNHYRAVRAISETFGKMAAEARSVLGNSDSKLLVFPGRQQLKSLKDEMEENIKDGRLTSIADSPEWGEFEATFQAYWEKIRLGPPVDWSDERDRLALAIEGLKRVVDQERVENNKRVQELSGKQRNKELAATIVVLLVSLIVAMLTFYEIRRILNQLGRAYAESSESRDHLQSLLDSLVSGVVVVGQGGKVETISDSFRKVQGLDAGEAGERDYEQLFAANGSLVEFIADGLKMPAQINRYYGRIEMGSGGNLFDVFASPLVASGEHRGIILVFVDVTEMARAHAELRRNRALTAVGQMTAQIAHEIKNPLGSIRFATEVLKRQVPDSDDSKETIGAIERSVDHLALIVAELSEFARPKELNRTEINLNSLLDGLLPMVVDKLTAKGIEVKKSYAPGLPSGNYDATELRKLFLNLIINAIDASSPDGHLELRTRLNGKRDVLVDIIDHGAGMDAETLRRLFEPFYTTKEKGTGLGMAIAKKITELHRGDLEVTSKKGEGTTATVRLPII